MSIQTGLTMAGADHLREQYAEREALETCRSATFLSVVKHFGLVPSIVVYTPKGKDLTLEGSDVWAARKKFFARMELDQHSCHLTVSGETLAELFSQWLLHEYSERYRCLTSEEQHQWLQRVVTLVVKRHLMETKYKLYLQGVQSFADPWACGVMCQLQILGSLPGELARMAHHIVCDPEQRTALIEQFYADTDDHMKRHPFVLPEPLPLLPEGVTLPFALLTQRKEGSNE